MPTTLDRHVCHRERPRAALLHRPLLAARLRELHARRCHAADVARNLERRALSLVPRCASLRHAAASLRRLRAALESVTMLARAPSRMSAAAAAQVAVAIPALNEEQSI